MALLGSHITFYTLGEVTRLSMGPGLSFHHKEELQFTWEKYGDRQQKADSRCRGKSRRERRAA